MWPTESQKRHPVDEASSSFVPPTSPVARSHPFLGGFYTTHQWQVNLAFEVAQTAIADDASGALADPDHAEDEDRFVLFGMSNVARLRVVVYGLRGDGDAIRITSARKATRGESSFSTAS